MSAILNTPQEAAEKPRYIHDCTCCVYLGSATEDNGHPLDLYVHASGDNTTVIARHGSDGPDYASGIFSSYGQTPSLTEARRRAQAAKLIEYNVYEALFYLGDPAADESCKEELWSAVPFTLEYQVFLAWKAQNFERAQGLKQHLVSLCVAKYARYGESRMRLAVVMEVSGRARKLVAARQRLTHIEACGSKELDLFCNFMVQAPY